VQNYQIWSSLFNPKVTIFLWFRFALPNGNYVKNIITTIG
jgi:glycerol uptake facilitator-like aquaporin